MSETFWNLYNGLDTALVQIDSLLKGTRCIRNFEQNANAETDLLVLAEEMLEDSREMLREMNLEYRKLENETTEAAATPSQKEGRV